MHTLLGKAIVEFTKLLFQHCTFPRDWLRKYGTVQNMADVDKGQA